MPPGFIHPTDEDGYPIPGAHYMALDGISRELCTAYQIYENVTEGSPVSPIFVGSDLRILKGTSDGRLKARTPEELRTLHQQGLVDVLGEVMAQYEGIAPDDARLEPYWALAESLDIPVGIHMGPGNAGSPYSGSPNYRARNRQYPLIKLARRGEIDHLRSRPEAGACGFENADIRGARIVSGVVNAIRLAAILAAAARQGRGHRSIVGYGQNSG